MTPNEAEMILLLAKTGEPSIPFNTAFQAARVLGRNDFQWQGKPYKAQTAEEARAPASSPPMRLPSGMKESDLYRDPAQEQIDRTYYDRTQQIEKDYQQALRDISFDSTQSEKNALRQYTSDMAPFEQNQLALRDLDQHMKQMREYEANEQSQGAVNEEVELQTQKYRDEIARLTRQLYEMQADTSLQDIHRYEEAERYADAQANADRLRGMQRQQAVQPLYPEALLPIPRLMRGLVTLLGRAQGTRRPQRERQEPEFNPDLMRVPVGRPEPTLNLNNLMAP